MHPEAIKALINKLKFLANNMVYPPHHELADKKILEVPGVTGGFSYTDDGFRTQAELLKQLLDKHRWDVKYSKRFLERAIPNAFGFCEHDEIFFHADRASGAAAQDGRADQYAIQ